MNSSAALPRRLPFFYGWAIVGAAGASMFVRNSAATLTIAVFVYPMSEDLGWSRTLIVGASATAGIAAMFFSPLAGWVLHRFGARALLGVSVLLLGAAILSIRWASTPVAFYLLFGIGRVIFSSPVQIGAATVVAQWFVKKRGRATAVLGVMHSFGMGLFPLFAQLLINSNGGDWRMAWFWLGISVWIVAVPPVIGLLRGTPESMGLEPDGGEAAGTPESAASRQAREPEWTLREAMRTPALWMLALAGGFAFFIHTGVNIHQAAFLRDQGLAATVAASALTVMAAGTALGSVAWGWLLDRAPVKLVYAASACWLGGASLLFLLVDSAAVAFVAAATFGVGLGALLVVPPVAIASYFGRRSLGAIRGVTEPFVSGAQALGAVGAGLVYDLTDSYSLTFPVFTGAALAAALLIVAVRRPTKPVVAPAPAAS